MTQQVTRSHPEIEQVVIAHERQGEGRDLGAVGAHDLLVARFEQQVLNVEAGRLGDSPDELPVGGGCPGAPGATGEGALAGKERDDVVAQGEILIDHGATVTKARRALGAGTTRVVTARVVPGVGLEPTHPFE